jgi:hypothetical protein
MRFVPVVDVPVDLVPDIFALYPGAVVKDESSSCEVAKPKDPGVLLVAVVLVSLADQILVQCDLCFVAPPLWGYSLDCVVELWLLLPLV